MIPLKFKKVVPVVRRSREQHRNAHFEMRNLVQVDVFEEQRGCEPEHIPQHGGHHENFQKIGASDREGPGRGFLSDVLAERLVQNDGDSVVQH
jgi:hypothetical protein